MPSKVSDMWKRVCEAQQQLKICINLYQDESVIKVKGGLLNIKWDSSKYVNCQCLLTIQFTNQMFEKYIYTLESVLDKSRVT